MISPVPPELAPEPIKVPRKQTIIEEARCILLIEILQQISPSINFSSHRRQSLPSVVTNKLRHVSLLRQQQLQAWGHTHLGYARSADALLAAISIRQPDSSTRLSQVKDEEKIPEQLNVRAPVRP
jgi:hypothetical protein